MAITNVKELRDFISENLDKLSDDRYTPAKANATANMLGKMLYSVKLEMDFNKMVGSSSNISFLKEDTSKKIEKKSE